MTAKQRIEGKILSLEITSWTEVQETYNRIERILKEINHEFAVKINQNSKEDEISENTKNSVKKETC